MPPSAYVSPGRRGLNSSAGENSTIESSSNAITPEVTIKVGLDEWVLISKNRHVELCTDGLSGCVAVVLISTDQALLAHVYSGAVDDWNNYKIKIKEFFDKMNNKITDSYFMKSEEFNTPLSENLKEIARHPGRTVSPLVGSGLKVIYRCSLQSFFCINKTLADSARYRTKYLTTSDQEHAKYIVASGVISKHGGAASPAS